MKTMAALVAQPALVNLGIAPRLQTEKRTVAMVDANVASGRATATDRIRRMQKPDARLESKIVRGQGSNRTDLRDVAGVGIREFLIVDGADAHVIAPPKELQLAGMGDFLEETDAARTLHATFLIQHDRPEVEG